jgi:pimeloyl-ACP methyl ester carboxylesterase
MTSNILLSMAIALPFFSQISAITLTNSNRTDCYPFAGQLVCEHDEGYSSGYFHTYDAIKLPGDGPKGRKIHIYLPRSYAQSDTRYPVVYFNDGQSIFFPNNGVGKTWRAQETLDSLYASRSIPEVIIVAVYPTEREEEYTHAAVPGRPCCKLDQYGEYLTQDLKNFVDQNYRTRPQREFNFIVGSSHGGLAAFFIAATHPEIFGGAGCLSSSFWVGMYPIGFPKRLKDSELIDQTRYGLSNPDQRPKLWLDWGLIRTGGEHNYWVEEHATRRGIEMAGLLRSEFGYIEGPMLRVVSDPIGDHTEDSWARRLPEVFRFLLASITDRTR